MTANQAEMMTDEQVLELLAEHAQLVKVRNTLRAAVEQSDQELAEARVELAVLGRMLVEEFPEEVDFVRGLGILRDEHGELDVE